MKYKKLHEDLRTETVAATVLEYLLAFILLWKFDTKLTLYKALIRSVLTFFCPAWEFAAD
jgi:uncharacterized membrane protein (GlpM family)